MREKFVLNLAASFNEQLSPVAPFLFYVVIAGIIFIETGLLIGFFYLVTHCYLAQDLLQQLEMILILPS